MLIETFPYPQFGKLAPGSTDIVGDEIDSRNLLKHLVDVGECDTVELSVFAHLEQTSIRALIHLLNGFFDSNEFISDKWVIAILFVKSLEDLQRLVISALHNKPTWGLWKIHDGDEDDDGKENLKRKWEPPSDFFLSNERHAYLLAVSILARI